MISVNDEGCRGTFPIYLLITLHRSPCSIVSRSSRSLCLIASGLSRSEDIQILGAMRQPQEHRAQITLSLAHLILGLPSKPLCLWPFRWPLLITL